MAITRASLTSGSSDTDATSYASASITPTTGRLIVACYNSANLTESVDPTQPTVTGNGLTWTVIDTFVWRTTGDRYRLSIAAADTTGASSGAVTFNNGAQTQEGAAWSIYELNGTDVASGVTQCFAQSVHSDINSTNSCPITLGSASDANNRPFYAMAKLSASGQPVTPQTSWTEIHEVYNVAPNMTLETQERLDTFDTSANATWTTGTGRGGIAWEIKVAGAGGGAVVVDPFGMSGFFGA